VIRFGPCLALACIACVRYQPRALDPARHPAEVRARSLADSALVAGVVRYAGRPAGARWTDRQLAVAALRLRADLRRLRAEWRAAGATVRTAGERPRGLATSTLLTLFVLPTSALRFAALPTAATSIPRRHSHDLGH
jgi:hypothetical protein